MTAVRSKRGKLIHAIEVGIRRDLAPEEIPTVVCGRKLKGAVVVPDEYITCAACNDILFNGN